MNDVMGNVKAKPFIKWVGGKRQLLPEIRKRYPERITVYAEPFLGGGAVLFDVLEYYKQTLEQAYVSDINADLINTYQALQVQPLALIDHLAELQILYHTATEEGKKTLYYEKREEYNHLSLVEGTLSIDKAALFIFLNKTCFNGLYRVNQKGEFNTPVGKYKKPVICDTPNLLAVNVALQGVGIRQGSYQELECIADHDSFFYLDPPYRPITKTSAFTAYTQNGFSDQNQKELADFALQLKRRGSHVLLSNSDPEDDFFEQLYQEFRIDHVLAKRAINAKGDKRGAVGELLIS